MAEIADQELKIRVEALLGQVEGRIPERLRSGGQLPAKRVIAPVACKPFLISKFQLGGAAALLRLLPEHLAAAAGCKIGWRDKPAIEMLKAWGWSANTTKSGSLSIDWVERKAVSAASFAPLAALAPIVGNGHMIFLLRSSETTDDGLFGIRIRGGKAEIRGGQKKVEYTLD